MRRPPINAKDERRQKILRVLASRSSDAVIVGTSLSQYLRREFFRVIDVENMALPGGSALTGLQILANAPVLPKLVMVESNLLYREADEELVESFRSRGLLMEKLRFMGQDLKPIQTIVAQITGAPSSADVMIKKVAKDPETEDYDHRREILLAGSSPLPSASVERQHVRIKEDEALDLSKAHIYLRKLRAVCEQLQSRGAAVWFYELPFPPLVMESDYVKNMRRLLHEHVLATGGFAFISLDGASDELTWTDAHHLDERSSIFICQELESVFKTRGN